MLNKLCRVQTKLKAPKSNFNSFGKYKYRSCEDILEAVKPILANENCTVNLSDEIVLIGDRYYVKAVATFMDCTDGKSVSVSAFAREEETKKGQDGSQITGTASSYARKYALNGLFLIDDTKDADTDEHAQIVKNGAEKDTSEPLATNAEKKVFYDRCSQLGVDYKVVAKQAGATSMASMTQEQQGRALIILKEIEEGAK